MLRFNFVNNCDRRSGMLRHGFVFFCSLLTISTCIGRGNAQTEDQIAYRWVGVHYKGNEIIGIGTESLPVPVRLPKGFTPLRNIALLAPVENTPYGSLTTFILYFDVDKEQKAKALGASRYVPLILKSRPYQVQVNMFDVGYQWAWAESFRTKGHEFGLLWGGQVNNGLTKGDGVSPLLGLKRQVYLTVSEHTDR